MSGLIDRMCSQLGEPDSPNRRIAASFALVGAFVMVGKLAGAAKEMAIAWRFGVNETVDAYVLVFSLVNWPVAVWLGVLTSVLVPLAAPLSHEHPSKLHRFGSELFALTLIVACALYVLAAWGMPAAFRAGWSGMPAALVNDAISMTPQLALLAPLGALIGFFSAWMLAFGRHTNTLLEAVPSLVLLVVLLLPIGQADRALVLGTVAGVAMHMLALGAPLVKKRELSLPSFRFHSTAWRGFFASLSVMVLGQVLMSFTAIVDQLLAGQLHAGALSTVSYANRILALVLSLGAMAISRATLPIFSQAAARKDPLVFRLGSKWTSVMFALGCVTLLAGWALAEPVVALLFERGAFTAENTKSVAEVLRYALVQVPFYFSGLVLVSVLTALKRYKTIAAGAGINLVMKFAFGFWWVAGFQLNGLVLSTAAMYLFSTVFLFVAVRRAERKPVVGTR